MLAEIKSQLESHRQVVEAMERDLATAIEVAVGLLADAYRDGKKMLVMGNGGSAADAQHLAAEIIGRFKMERRALPAIALTTDTSILTAVGNDYGFDRVFSRQVEGLAQPGDVVIGISTSGNSPNVEIALKAAAAIGCKTVALLGRDGGSIGKLVDLPLIVPSQDTPRIQEGHITIIHIVCDLLEKTLFKAAKP
ncbi:D-sedoheptulose 7-phosphate isomerase [Geomonas sp. Red32]|uniref:D-sedoheptulose 7-phosphate isomerase n=1 Tax=Geomonas sp. Red32 TaxID=2912856 RepID=UPI00202CF6D1|nr:D-sedoheptulose 7-phosphate isomerase [Geomonas sp. Red32]MCM0081733.1 D-sedoheptulose 7-phosphate isomerase [Geomonas sp. Red32]